MTLTELVNTKLTDLVNVRLEKLFYNFPDSSYNSSRKEIRRIGMYQLIKKDGNAKRGTFHTVHGDIQTPVFMNVGTVAAI